MHLGRVTLSGVICLAMLLGVACKSDPTGPPDEEPVVDYGSWNGEYQGEMDSNYWVDAPVSGNPTFGVYNGDVTLVISGGDSLSLEFYAESYDSIYSPRTWLFETVTINSQTSIESEYVEDAVLYKIRISRTGPNNILGEIKETRSNPDNTTTLDFEGEFSVSK